VVTYDLKHGVRLAISKSSGQLIIRDVGDFLAKAVEFFKHRRDTLKTTIYADGPFGHTVSNGRRILGELQLSCRDESLRAAQWTDSVIDAYTRVDTLEQMSHKLRAYEQKNAQQPEDYVTETLRLLRAPDGGLLALSAFLRHGIAPAQPPSCHQPHIPDFSKTRIRYHYNEYFVSVGDVYCLISPELRCRLGGFKIASGTPMRIHGIACDATFYVFGRAPQYRACDITPEAKQLALRLIDFFPQLPRDAGPYPITVDVSPSDEFTVSTSKSKRVNHC
jgi:hypothetical protein